jgi:hypothetical protein
VDDGDAAEVDRPQPDEAVIHGEDDLADDREQELVEQVVGLGDRTDEGALDRQHAERGLPGGHRLGDGAEARHRRDGGTGREQRVAGRSGVRAGATRVDDGDTHRPRSTRKRRTRALRSG